MSARSSPNKQPRRPTIADVAIAVGVSKMTVSRVLNGHPDVHPITQRRIEAAIQRLSFIPSSLARGLKARRTMTVGLLLPTLSDPFFGACASGVNQVALKNDYLVTIISAEDNEAIAVPKQLQALARQRVDGILVAPSAPHVAAEMFADVNVPLVAFDNPIPQLRCPTLLFNNRAASKQAVEHLLTHGYQHVICINKAGPVYSLTERVAGYSAAVRQAGLQPEVLEIKAADPEDTAELLGILRERQMPDALFTTNVSTTAIALRVLQEMRLASKRRPALIAFGEPPLCGVLLPTLSAIRPPAVELGRRAMEVLLTQMSGAEEKIVLPGKPIVLSAPLVLGSSCGCPLR